MPKMHSNSECGIKCAAVYKILNNLRRDCSHDQDYHKLNQVENALQLITELKGEFDVPKS
jgi:hypothetical protein